MVLTDYDIGLGSYIQKAKQIAESTFEHRQIGLHPTNLYVEREKKISHNRNPNPAFTENV